MIARTGLGPVRIVHLDSGLRGQPVEHGSKIRTCTGTSDIYLAVAYAPDHVHVQHGHRLLDRQLGMLGIISRTEQPLFLTREGQTQNAELLLWLFGIPAR